MESDEKKVAGVVTLDLNESLGEQLQRNDPHWTTVALTGIHTAEHVRHVGTALLHNTIVSTLSIRVWSLLQAEEQVTNSTAPLLEYIQTSTTLRFVDLHTDNGRHNAPEWRDQLFGVERCPLSQEAPWHIVGRGRRSCCIRLTEQLFHAVSASSSIIKLGVNVDGSSGFVLLAKLLQQSRSIETLDIAVSGKATSRPMQRLARAFEANSTVLTLHVHASSDDTEALVSIFQVLDGHSRLNQLAIYCRLCINHYAPPNLQPLLETTQRSLQHLDLHGGCCGHDFALVWPSLGAYLSLKSLGLHTVAFDEANTQAFLHYIKNLPRHNDFALRLYRCKFPGEWTGTKCVLEDLLEPESAPCLQSLECARCSALVTIVQKSSTLSKLILCVNYIPLALDVIPYLALLKQLTHLTLKFEHEDAENEPALLAALFRNGSLHEIVVTHAKGCGHIPEEKLWAVGQRNKVGPTLLHDCLATTAVTDATTSDDRGDSESDEAVVLAADSAPIATSADAPAKPAVSLAPSLVVVTTQAPLLAFKRVWNAMAKWNPSEQKNATNRGKKRSRASLKAD